MLLVCVKGLYVLRAQYALPFLCMVVRPRYLFTNTYISLRALLCMPGMSSVSIQDYVVSMWCAHENSLFLSLKTNKRIP